jgi:hypothetical protein
VFVYDEVEFVTASGRLGRRFVRLLLHCSILVKVDKGARIDSLLNVITILIN